MNWFLGILSILLFLIAASLSWHYFRLRRRLDVYTGSVRRAADDGLALHDLPEDEKFERLAPSRKRLTDTVKLVAYRAETALAMIVREQSSHPEEARSLVRDLFRSDADIHPDQAAGVLDVRLHTLANPRSNRAIQHLLDHLNAAEFSYPGTKLRLTYSLSAPQQNHDLVPS